MPDPTPEQIEAAADKLERLILPSPDGWNEGQAEWVAREALTAAQAHDPVVAERDDAMYQRNLLGQTLGDLIVATGLIRNVPLTGPELLAHGETAKELVANLRAEVERLREALNFARNELSRWGWGDFRFGSQPQEPSVVAALEICDAALAKIKETP